MLNSSFLPVQNPGRQQVLAPVVGSLPPTLEPQVELLAPDFDLANPWVSRVHEYFWIEAKDGSLLFNKKEKDRQTMGSHIKSNEHSPGSWFSLSGHSSLLFSRLTRWNLCCSIGLNNPRLALVLMGVEAFARLCLHFPFLGTPLWSLLPSRPKPPPSQWDAI